MQSVLESAVNIAEKVTGKDIDGDGDVGMRAAKVARRGEPTETITNIAENYKWEAYYHEINSRKELIDKADECRSKGVPLRVLASGWSCNRFIDPTPKATGCSKNVGVNIKLCGELAEVLVHKLTKTTVTAMAGAMRGPIYEVLNNLKPPRQLDASGECYTEEASQQVGGLIANGVHDTMQRAFTPETVPELEALVFENGKAVIKTFTAADGDDFYAFFGGMGMTGIIVSATISTVEKTYYQSLCYLPGVKYMHDPSFEVYQKAMTQEQLVLIHDIKEQCPPSKTYDVGNPTDYLKFDNSSPFKTYVSPFATALHDLVEKHHTGCKDVIAMFYQFPDPEKSDNTIGPDGLPCGAVCSTGSSGLGRFYRCVNPDGPVDLPKYTGTER